MNQQKMRAGVKSVMYHGDTCLGEVEVFPVKNSNNSHIVNRPIFRFPNNEIRISCLSPATDRCLPHSVLQAFAPFSVRCKIQATSSDKTSPLHTLYLTCFTERRTAVVVLGHEELHMVALPSRAESFPCFWCFFVPIRLFGPCLGMLNLRCLAIVFDLDETLIVANTMKSFEDRIEGLSIRIDAEDDPLRVSGMSAELKRYLEDKVLLKQYIETNTVNDVNGRLITVQNEEVRPLTTSHIPIVRPVIRLQEKNIILTRINPEVRQSNSIMYLYLSVFYFLYLSFFNEYQ